jgi:hypothetical protein
MQIRVRRVSEPVAFSVRQIFFSRCGSSCAPCDSCADAAMPLTATASTAVIAIILIA